jgi:hypothetical protein
MEMNVLNMVKGVYKKPLASLNAKDCTGSPNHFNKARKRNKRCVG